MAEIDASDALEAAAREAEPSAGATLPAAFANLILVAIGRTFEDARRADAEAKRAARRAS